MILGDSGQLHQVLVNLVVNARDAMPEGGRLTLGTETTEIDAAAAARFPDTTPGRYAVLIVSDTGTGMDKETRARVFEPFFTTKEAGKGTGLGLATVYGIVRQCGGWIRLESEPGRGTAFRIGFPFVAGSPAKEEPLARIEPSPGGSETLLVVEDQEEVRQFTAAVLTNCGYRVLQAASGTEALQVVERYGGRIHLLVTDVVMPQMTGKQLAEQLLQMLPDLRVLFVSGYSDEVISHWGVLDPGVEFLSKPFHPKQLVAKVQSIIGH
jgi:CheY-like chemotaxis protein